MATVDGGKPHRLVRVAMEQGGKKCPPVDAKLLERSALPMAKLAAASQPRLMSGQKSRGAGKASGALFGPEMRLSTQTWISLLPLPLSV